MWKLAAAPAGRVEKEKSLGEAGEAVAQVALKIRGRKSSSKMVDSLFEGSVVYVFAAREQDGVVASRSRCAITPSQPDGAAARDGELFLDVEGELHVETEGHDQGQARATVRTAARHQSDAINFLS